jgi:O-antigen/teichoic acid export membrane protein
VISKSFLKSSIVFTLGGALPMVASIILLPFYTNYLSDLNYTQVTFYITVSLLLQILFSFSIESYFGIKYTQLYEEPDKQKKFIGTVSILLLLIGIGLLIITAFFGNFIFSKIHRKDLLMEFWPYGFYSVLTAFFNSYFKASTISLIYLKKSRLFLGLNFINFIATIAISIAGMYIYPNTIIGPIYGRLLSGVIIFFLAQYIFFKQGEFVLEKKFLKELVQFCMPYVFYVICTWVLSFFDRYILQKYISNEDFNAYDLVLKCFFGIEFLQNSLSAVIFPKLYEIWNKEKTNTTTKESNRYFNVFTAINILQLILFCVFIPIIYKLIIHNQNFYRSEVYIGILAAGYALRSIFNFYLSTILFTKKIGILFKIFGISAAFQIIVTIIVAKEYGLMGAIYAGLGTKVLQVILFMLFTKNVFTYKFNYFKIIVLPLAFVSINVLQFLVFKNYNIIQYLIQLVIFGILFFLLFRNEIRQTLVSFGIVKKKIV